MEEELLQGQLQVVDKQGLSDQVQARVNGTSDGQLHGESNGSPVKQEVPTMEEEPVCQPQQQLESEGEVKDAEKKVQDVGQESPPFDKKEEEVMVQGLSLAGDSHWKRC